MLHRLLLLLALLTLGAATAGALPQADAPWSSHVVMTAPGKLGGCAVGDLDPAHPGNEIVSVCVTGQVFLSRPDRGRWVSEPIVQAAGELLQCAIGDADPTRPGNELVVVGMRQGTENDGGPGVAYLVYRTEELVDGKPRVRWQLEQVCQSSALIHAVAIADVDPDSPGLEIITAGFDKNYHEWTKRDGQWTSLRHLELPGNAKSLVPFQDGIAVACDDGSLILVGPEGWSGAFNKASSGQSRLGAADGRLLVARDDGQLVLITGDGQAATIHGERQKLRGAVLAELDPENPGLEAATVGYEMKMTVLYPILEKGGVEEDGDEVLEWIPRVVHTDVDRFHHLAVGELDPESPGLEIVGCGYSGRVIVAGKSPE